jgi:hypothetical protein
MTATTADLKRFAWRRWGAAERRQSKLNGRAAAKQESVCDFWRRAYNAYEAREAAESHDQTLGELAVANVGDGDWTAYDRQPGDDLPENLPDLPFVALSPAELRRTRQ